MTNKRLYAYAPLLFSSFSMACPNWQASTTNNQISGWDHQLNPQNIRVVSDPKGSDARVVNLTITENSTWPNGHTRAEVKHDGCATHEGENTYFSWEFYLEEPIKRFNHIAYWETAHSYQQSMGFYLTPKIENGKSITELAFFSNQPHPNVHWQTILQVGKWHKIAMAITWSEKKENGKISLWFNGQKVVTQLAAKTKPDTHPLFIQLGLHRNQSEAPIDSIYIRKAKETTSLALLLNK
ncbi:heparin lyase I family protein [Paraglaciecola sp. 2405UD69-4]|uniref:heparin lyase I family protein n=1 Tax=Paraglaciecola sp. 2405UD69-4 TaxID=3391836 RepID=UPI0039C90FA4